MSIRFGAALFAALAIGSVAAQDTSTEKGKLSYAIGFEIGSDFVDKKMDVDVNTVIRGIQDGIAKRPLKNSEVTVHYRGSLTSGLEFDSSFARGVPATFKVDAVLKGWQDILPMMKVGDHWQLFLPPEQAYGMRGQGPIGPNEALVFEIKLVDVK